MLEFISLLRHRYQAVLAQLSENSTVALTYQQRLEQLTFAEAFLRKGLWLESAFQPPLQIAIIGPTQAGKSSVSNLILNSDVAGVSSLAGYTVHPHGFCVGIGLSDCRGLQQYFGRYQQLTPAQLTRLRYDCYALAENTHPAPLLPPCILWDTPDFDSIDSADYKEGVIRTIALADIIVLVVSKEKYADQSVWEIMAAIGPFKQPTLVCLNKLGEGDDEIIVRSLREKWQQVRNDDFPEVVTLFYQRPVNLLSWPKHQYQLFFQLASRAGQRKHLRLQQELLNRYWDDWIEPVIAEHQTLDQWQTMLTKALAHALQEYQRDYLGHPHHYETFQRALFELLTLLEIPGLSKILSKLRRVLTWPVRKLVDFGKSRKQNLYANQELAFLAQISEHLLLQISEQLLEKSDTDIGQQRWWKDIYYLLKQQKPLLLEDFNQAAVHYHDEFQTTIDDAAQRLYVKLKQHPVLLNGLRATRFSTDAAAMAMVLQTGGVGLHDLVITPAMLSITSLLAESAISSYMQRVEAELKQQQLSSVNNQLFMAYLHYPLSQLPQQLKINYRFNISLEQLQDVQQQRSEKRHGLRLL